MQASYRKLTAAERITIAALRQDFLSIDALLKSMRIRRYDRPQLAKF